jgi:hypothetical protein
MKEDMGGDYHGEETIGFKSPAQDHIEHVIDLAEMLDLCKPGMSGDASGRPSPACSASGWLSLATCHRVTRRAWTKFSKRQHSAYTATASSAATAAFRLRGFLTPAFPCERSPIYPKWHSVFANFRTREMRIRLTREKSGRFSDFFARSL